MKITQKARAEINRVLDSSFRTFSFGRDFGRPETLLASEAFPIFIDDPYCFRFYIWTTAEAMHAATGRKAEVDGAKAFCAIKLERLKGRDKKKIDRAANVQPFLGEIHFNLEWLTPQLVAHEVFHLVNVAQRLKGLADLQRENIDVEEQFADRIQYCIEQIYRVIDFLKELKVVAQ